MERNNYISRNKEMLEKLIVSLITKKRVTTQHITLNFKDRKILMIARKRPSVK